MTLLKGDPLKDLTSLQDRMNRIFSDSLKRLKEIGEPESDKPWSPPADIVERPDSFIIMAEVPGVPKESVTVEFIGGSLFIRGIRPSLEPTGQGTLYHSERKYGPFERTFELPVSVRHESITAKLTDGVLMVTIAKKESESRRIQVNIE